MPRLDVYQLGVLARTQEARKARISAARPSRESCTVERLLSASRFHPRAIQSLASRRHYADALLTLAPIVESDRIYQFTVPNILAERMQDDVRRWRLAVRFKLITDKAMRLGQSLSPMTLERLRASKNDAAPVVLACTGEINWRSASRRVRAGYVLHRLVAARVS